MKKRWICIWAVLLALASCEKTSDMPENTDAPVPAPAVPETTVPETSQPETDAPDPPQETEETTEPIPDGTSALSAEADASFSFPFDDTNDVFILYDYRRDENGEIIRENGHNIRENIRVQMYEKETGAFSVLLSIEGNVVPGSISYTEDGFILYHFVSRENGPEEIAAWKVTTAGDTPTIAPTEYDVTVSRGRAYTSPDGRWTAYNVTTDLHGNGGVAVADADGEERMIAVNVMLDPENPTDIGRVRGYEVVGFLDETQLVYRIGGWEWSGGFGIYAVQSGEKREVSTQCTIKGLHDGALYGVKSESYETVGVYRIDPGGTETLLAEPESAKGTMQEIMFRGGKWYEFRNGKWLVIPEASGNSVRGLIFSADFSEVIADVTGSTRQQIYEEYYRITDN